jgi:hypothetical protein
MQGSPVRFFENIRRDAMAFVPTVIYLVIIGWLLYYGVGLAFFGDCRLNDFVARGDAGAACRSLLVRDISGNAGMYLHFMPKVWGAWCVSTAAGLALAGPYRVRWLFALVTLAVFVLAFHIGAVLATYPAMLQAWRNSQWFTGFVAGLTALGVFTSTKQLLSSVAEKIRRDAMPFVPTVTYLLIIGWLLWFGVGLAFFGDFRINGFFGRGDAGAASRLFVRDVSGNAWTYLRFMPEVWGAWCISAAAGLVLVGPYRAGWLFALVTLAAFLLAFHIGDRAHAGLGRAGAARHAAMLPALRDGQRFTAVLAGLAAVCGLTGPKQLFPTDDRAGKKRN